MKIFRNNKTWSGWPDVVASLPEAALITAWATYPKVDGKYDRSTYDDAVITKALESEYVKERVADGRLFVLDLESWPLFERNSLIPNEENFHNFSHVLTRWHDAYPGIALGLYGVLPRREYFGAIGLEHRKPTEARGESARVWRMQNAIAAARLGAYVDVLCPSIYDHYGRQDEWERYAVENLQEAEKLGKRIYAYLTPVLQKDQVFSEGDHFRKMLELCEAYGVDGVIMQIYDPSGGKEWKSEWEWAAGLVEYLEKR